MEFAALLKAELVSFRDNPPVQTSSGKQAHAVACRAAEADIEIQICMPRAAQLSHLVLCMEADALTKDKAWIAHCTGEFPTLVLRVG